MQILNIVMCVISAETFSSTLTSEEENSGMGGIAMLTLSDTENNLHFILILQGLIKHKDKGETERRGAQERKDKEMCFGMILSGKLKAKQNQTHPLGSLNKLYVST